MEAAEVLGQELRGVCYDVFSSAELSNWYAEI
jgi:hypothetical protein